MGRSDISSSRKHKPVPEAVSCPGLLEFLSSCEAGGMAESRQRRWGAGALSEQAVSEGKSAGRVGAEQVGHRVVLGMPPCREEETGLQSGRTAKDGH